MARQRRRNMRSVDVYAMDDAPLTREFAAGCRTVAELYSLTLGRTEQPIKATVSWTRIFVDRRVRPGAPSRIEDEPSDGFGFSDGMRCAVDPSILAAEATLRPRRFLEWLHERMVELARARGWDETVLHQAFKDCVDADLTLVVTSKPRSSPDRQHRATLTLRMNPDSTGSIELAIADRDGVECGRTTAARACSVDDFRPLARQMRWVSASEVTADDDRRTLGVPGSYRLTARVGEAVDVDTAQDFARLRAFAAQHGELDSDARTFTPDAADSEDFEYEPDVLPARRLTLIGGGPVGTPWGISDVWSTTFTALLGNLDNRPEWRAWWERADQPECAIQYYTDEPATRVRIRRAASQVKVSFERPKETVHPVAEARADAEAVISAIAERFGLQPAPPLDDVPAQRHT